ncbi:DUF2877 domain-containing protein [Enterococcus faecium]|nr:DUF2877 domain-containing protein [Enterococcus faecium]
MGLTPSGDDMLMGMIMMSNSFFYANGMVFVHFNSIRAYTNNKSK